MWRSFFSPSRRNVVVWVVIATVIVVGWTLNLSKGLLAVIFLIGGLFTQAFTFVVSLIAVIPVFGPILVSILTWPVLFIIKGMTFIMTYFAIRRGYGRDIIRANVLASTFFVGILLGFILGRVI
jgi:hypothetical protein